MGWQVLWGPVALRHDRPVRSVHHARHDLTSGSTGAMLEALANDGDSSAAASGPPRPVKLCSVSPGLASASKRMAREPHSCGGQTQAGQGDGVRNDKAVH